MTFFIREKGNSRSYRSVLKRLSLFGIFLLLAAMPLVIFLTGQQQEVRERAASNTIPSFTHVFLIMMENHDYSQIIGSSAAVYINSLANQYGLATNYKAITHPSLPNYIALTSGSTQGITSDCNTCSTNAQSIFEELEKTGKTWKAYMESMPSNCATGDSGSYVQHHNPPVYYTNLRSSGSCAKNDVSYTPFHTDLASDKVGNFNFIVPNNSNDMHSGTIQAGDAWLQQEVPAILNSNAYKQNGLLIITWDEGLKGTNTTNQVATIIISPSGKSGFKSSTAYTHYSLLRTIADGLGVSPLGQSATAIPMSDFFSGVQPSITSPTSITTPQPTSSRGTPTPIPTNPPSPTGEITATPILTQQVTPPSTDTIFSLSLILPGVGAGGGNMHPLHPIRDITLWLYNLGTRQLTTKKDSIIFDGSSFINPTIDVGTIPSGNYQLFVKSDQFLITRLSQSASTSTISLQSGQKVILPPSPLLSGDIAPQQKGQKTNYGDNILDIQDYNLLLSCYGAKAQSSTCMNKQAADLDDNGIIDAIDYNLLLRAFATTTQGDTIPGLR